MRAAKWRLGRLAAVLIAMFVALNGLLLLAERRGTSSPIGLYGMERFARAHPGWNEADLKVLDEESFGSHLQLRYHPFAAFRSPAVEGRFVQVAPAGFRRHRDLPWPPAAESCSVFLFGGSTAFGLALSDAEGLGAALEEELSAVAGPGCAVYNFSVPAHFSSNEQGLFLDLVREGATPRLAIFVDGVNEFFYLDGRPEMYYFLDHVMSRRARWDVVYSLPVVRWLQAVRVARRGRREVEAPPAAAERAIETAARRWRRNITLTAAAAAAVNVETLFVVQPSPAYGYDLRHHLFAEGDAAKLGRHRAAASGYEILSRLGLDAGPPAPRVLWLADLQRDRAENLYVDMIHYTAAFSRDIAGAVARAAAPLLPVSSPR